MSAVGYLIPLPVADRVPVQASPRVISLHPDSRKVWGYRVYRQPSAPHHEGLIYGADAGLSRDGQIGTLIDVFA